MAIIERERRRGEEGHSKGAWKAAEIEAHSAGTNKTEGRRGAFGEGIVDRDARGAEPRRKLRDARFTL